MKGEKNKTLSDQSMVLPNIDRSSGPSHQRGQDVTSSENIQRESYNTCESIGKDGIDSASEIDITHASTGSLQAHEKRQKDICSRSVDNQFTELSPTSYARNRQASNSYVNSRGNSKYIMIVKPTVTDMECIRTEFRFAPRRISRERDPKHRLDNNLQKSAVEAITSEPQESPNVKIQSSPRNSQISVDSPQSSTAPNMLKPKSIESVSYGGARGELQTKTQCETISSSSASSGISDNASDVLKFCDVDTPRTNISKATLGKRIQNQKSALPFPDIVICQPSKSIRLGSNLSSVSVESSGSHRSTTRASVSQTRSLNCNLSSTPSYGMSTQNTDKNSSVDEDNRRRSSKASPSHLQSSHGTISKPFRKWPDKSQSDFQGTSASLSQRSSIGRAKGDKKYTPTRTSSSVERPEAFDKRASNTNLSLTVLSSTSESEGEVSNTENPYERPVRGAGKAALLECEIRTLAQKIKDGESLNERERNVNSILREKSNTYKIHMNDVVRLQKFLQQNAVNLKEECSRLKDGAADITARNELLSEKVASTLVLHASIRIELKEAIRRLVDNEKTIDILRNELTNKVELLQREKATVEQLQQQLADRKEEREVVENKVEGNKMAILSSIKTSDNSLALILRGSDAANGKSDECLQRLLQIQNVLITTSSKSNQVSETVVNSSANVKLRQVEDETDELTISESIRELAGQMTTQFQNLTFQFESQKNLRDQLYEQQGTNKVLEERLRACESQLAVATSEHQQSLGELGACRYQLIEKDAEISQLLETDSCSDYSVLDELNTVQRINMTLKGEVTSLIESNSKSEVALRQAHDDEQQILNNEIHRLQESIEFNNDTVFQLRQENMLQREDARADFDRLVDELKTSRENHLNLQRLYDEATTPIGQKVPEMEKEIIRLNSELAESKAETLQMKGTLDSYGHKLSQFRSRLNEELVSPRERIENLSSNDSATNPSGVQDSASALLPESVGGVTLNLDQNTHEAEVLPSLDQNIAENDSNAEALPKSANRKRASFATSPTFYSARDDVSSPLNEMNETRGKDPATGRKRSFNEAFKKDLRDEIHSEEQEESLNIARPQPGSSQEENSGINQADKGHNLRSRKSALRKSTSSSMDQQKEKAEVSVFSNIQPPSNCSPHSTKGDHDHDASTIIVAKSRKLSRALGLAASAKQGRRSEATATASQGKSKPGDSATNEKLGQKKPARAARRRAGPMPAPKNEVKLRWPGKGSGENEKSLDIPDSLA